MIDVSCVSELSLIGVGVDVIHLHRLSKAIKRNPRFFDRLAHSSEYPQWTGHDSIGLLWAGYLWTGKEGVAKALKTGVWREGIDWPDLIVGHKIESFDHLKTHFKPWSPLLFDSSTSPNSLLVDHTSPIWVQGWVNLLGPALHRRSHLLLKHSFTLVAPPHRTDRLTLEDYQALSIVYAWDTSKKEHHYATPT